MRNNNQTNNLIKWAIILGDFIALNVLLIAFFAWDSKMHLWSFDKGNVFHVVCNLALAIAEYRFYTVIHLRMVSSADILRRIVLLVVTQTIAAYLILKTVDHDLPVGFALLRVGTVYLVLQLVMRYLERYLVKFYRQSGGNTRCAIFVGSDPELNTLYHKLKEDPALGYKIMGYYADEDIEGNNGELVKLGTLKEFMEKLDCPQELVLGDEVYVCLPRREKETIRKISQMCDLNIKRFYYVQVSLETIGINLKKEFVDDVEVYTTHENPLQNPINKALKRLFDIALSIVFLIPTIIIFPFVYLIVKIQSPGPIFFKQLRTGLDGQNFYCYKFRSMYVNKEADTVQATKHDPRKFPFGSFMRKFNIDELPQFANVLIGNMSIVGPRPHMLEHTKQYSQLIDKYMVRHFVKPGVTGWAQVSGFRGETKELWQMEGRVKRDIWYMEHWTIWLDLRIIFLTFRKIFTQDKNAY
jgi:putative colanic acid biosynthesis UDP-glucose lipid carrier transferase